MTYRGKQSSGPWYRDGRELVQFEWGVRSKMPTLQRFIDRQGLRYDLTVEVPHYEARRVAILFRPDYLSPAVTVDGLTDSPHRYPSGTLCMWYHKDDASLKWVRSDKLLALIGLIVRHLFKEAWWRETGDWLGPEVPHGQKIEESEERKHE
jgi:hypothetical protein